MLSQGLVITPSSFDAGLYTCETVELVKGKEHREIVIQYLLQAQDSQSLDINLVMNLIIMGAILLGVVLYLRMKCIEINNQGTEMSNISQVNPGSV